MGTAGGSRHSLRTAVTWVQDRPLAACSDALLKEWGAGPDFQAQTDPRSETRVWGGGGDEPLPFPATRQMETASVAGAPSGMKDPSSPAGVQGRPLWEPGIVSGEESQLGQGHALFQTQPTSRD